jgi:hypothetical protein
MAPNPARAGVVLMLAGTALATAGVVLSVTGGPLAAQSATPSTDHVTVGTAATTWAPTTAATTATTSRRTQAFADRAPVSVRLPGASTAPVLPVGVRDDGTMMLPPATTVGWWAGGAQVDQPVGAMVLAGHVDDDRGRIGVFAGIATLRSGDLVTVGTVTSQATYRVKNVRAYGKQRLPAALFAADGPHRLVLITCGGEFTPGSGYADNVVAVAEPAR